MATRTHPQPSNLCELFELAMLREIPDFSPGRQELRKLNIGAGNKLIIDTDVLDYPKFDANHNVIPAKDGEIGVIYCFGTLDHIENVPFFMKECQRVLAPGGVMNISVAFYKSNLAWEDPYHKSWFTENTWKKLFEKQYWNPDDFEWKFRIGINMIIGVQERNIIVLTQLIKRNI